ncbi:rod-binding protein [Aliarcobacter lanthieri]|uniref:rod-binding protein n=1 Tax=Aliarcobacter lanthieri TaxID=1355374 RepID=UPI001920EF4D|nr:rod-binding protein [Aliarcobacter lanthieri]MBL3519860.1 rod-binding protein [Aliarcobacter lanthieri]
MEINSSNLYNKDILQTNKFDSINSENISKMEDEKLREVSNNFESFFLQQILETSLKTTSVAGEGTGSDIIKSMYLQAVADNSSGTFGISDMLYKFLSENNNKQ